jgi:hypothetical protein
MAAAHQKPLRLRARANSLSRPLAGTKLVTSHRS